MTFSFSLCVVPLLAILVTYFRIELENLLDRKLLEVS